MWRRMVRSLIGWPVFFLAVGMVGFVAVADGTGAEELRPGAEMNVHLESDHHLVVRMRVAAHVGSGGGRRWKSVRRW